MYKTMTQENDWYSRTSKKLKDIQEIPECIYGSAPNSRAVNLAQKIINILKEIDFPPAGLFTSKEEGICIYFLKK